MEFQLDNDDLSETYWGEAGPGGDGYDFLKAYEKFSGCYVNVAAPTNFISLRFDRCESDICVDMTTIVESSKNCDPDKVNNVLKFRISFVLRGPAEFSPGHTAIDVDLSAGIRYRKVENEWVSSTASAPSKTYTIFKVEEGTFYEGFKGGTSYDGTSEESRYRISKEVKDGLGQNFELVGPPAPLLF